MHLRRCLSNVNTQPEVIYQSVQIIWMHPSIATAIV